MAAKWFNSLDTNSSEKCKNIAKICLKARLWSALVGQKSGSAATTKQTLRSREDGETTTTKRQTLILHKHLVLES